MAVPRAPSSGLLGSGTYPNFTHPIDVGGAIQAAASAASSTIHNAFLRKIATQNANLATQREAREARIAQENADTNKSYRESLGAQRQAMANLTNQESQMRTPEFQAAYADAMTNGTPSSIAHVAAVVAGHPNAAQILAPLVRPDPKMNQREIQMQDGRWFRTNGDGTASPIMDSTTGKPLVGPAKSVSDPVKTMIDREAITRSTTADKGMSTLLAQRPRITMPVKGPFGTVDQATTNANRAGFTADSTALAGEQTAAHQGLTDLGIRPPTAAVAPTAGVIPATPERINALRGALKAGKDANGNPVTLDHVIANPTIPPEVKAQMQTEFGQSSTPGAIPKGRIKTAPPVVNAPAQTAPVAPTPPIPLQTTPMGGTPKPDDETEE